MRCKRKEGFDACSTVRVEIQHGREKTKNDRVWRITIDIELREKTGVEIENESENCPTSAASGKKPG